MKASSILIALLVVNSGLFASQILIQFIGALNPYIIGGVELVLGVAYYGHSIVKDVRNAFDVTVTMK